MSEATIRKTRRTQVERTAETREALLQATILLLHGKGYSGTTTELIADEAGVSRGALRHHYPTRAALMADVVSIVYEQEHQAYQDMEANAHLGLQFSDWPEMLWEVLSKPSGLAVLEILQASRSDTELAELIAPLQARLERMSIATMRERFGSMDEAESLAAIRFFVWSIRGLSIAQVLVPDPAELRRSIEFFRRIVEGAVLSGALKAGPALT